MRSNPRVFDVIVLGVGGMGSAAAYHLAKRGVRVLALERHNIPNDQGSSHGLTRIIRLPYYEHPSYTPLLRRAYALWRETQAEAGEPLLFTTGSVDAGPPGSQVFEGSRACCIEHDLPHEVLTSAALTKRFPGYALPSETLAVFQPDGGFLAAGRCVSAHAKLAQAHGAEIHAREPVLDWEPTSTGVRVRTDRGTYEAAKLIVAAGAWASKILPRLQGLAVPERQVLAWLQPTQPALFEPNRFPVFNLTVDEGRYYGLPTFGAPGFKFGRWHHLDEQVDPDTVNRECDRRDEDVLRAFAERYFPLGAGPTMAMAACMFTYTADGHFFLDTLPDHPQVVIASPCSGHGIKFASIVGEITADLAMHGATSHDISMHRLARLEVGHA